MRRIPSSVVRPSNARHVTFSRVVAQTWLMVLTWVPSKATSGAVATTSTASAGTALYLGLADPTLIMLGCGVLARLITLPVSLYGDKCLARLSNAMPELIKAYDGYTAIADHPKSIGWERKVARSKLKRDRQRIFGLHGTGSLRTFVPQMVSSCLAVYLALVPAAIVNTAAIVTVPLIPIGSYLVGKGSLLDGQAIEGAVAMLDGGFALAAALTIFNAVSVANRRLGFNSNLDERLVILKKFIIVGGAAAVVSTCYIAPLIVAQTAALIGLKSIPVTVIPSYLAPFWLGMAATSTVQQAIHNVAPLRSLFDIPRYPPTHSTYGTASTGSMIDRGSDDASTQIDEYERNEQWRKHKMLLDFECNMKIYKLLKFLRLETAEDDYERQRERLAFRIAAKKNSDGTVAENPDQLISQELPKGQAHK